VGRQFFELPAEEKEAVAKLPDVDCLEGYDSIHSKRLESWNSHLLHKIWPPSCIDYRFWPKNPPDYREVNEEYARQVKKLTEKIMGCLSKGLGLGHDALNEGIGGDAAEYTIRINYYPPTSDEIIGAPAHTDFTSMALLVPNEVPGLQVFKGNSWFDVENVDSGIVFLIGDQIMRMSNGRYKNVLHRATMDKEKTRMSWPVLVDPKRGLVVGPLPELIGDDNPPKFESLTFEDYIHRKINMLLHDG
jgi:flavonol synthase